MSKPFIALYKALRGGEWFRASLESIREHTDGAVVVFSTPWVDGMDIPGNCLAPLLEFQAEHPDYPVKQLADRFPSSVEQYAAGLAMVAEHFGPDAAVMVVDTDEVWDTDAVAALRAAVESRPDIHYFRSRLYSYLRSPLYRVWPTETAKTCVALQNAKPQPTPNRFAVSSPSTCYLPDLAFHHFTYVRELESDLRDKFVTTSSQESIPSNPAWWERVWPNLPRGQSLHMTPGFEHCWGEIMPIVPGMLPAAVQDLPFVDRLIALEEARWRDDLRTTPPGRALIPVPTEEDRIKYGAPLWALLGREHFEPGILHTRMKTTYAEALWLAYWASEVPKGGRILEIGSGVGGSTAVLSMASDSSVWIEAVDPFEAYDEQTHAGVVHGVHEGNEGQFWNTARCFGYSDRLELWPVSSLEVEAQLVDRYDLIFVDGNHSADIVESDLRLAWSRLKPGGILIGHDYTTRFPGVIQAADAMDAECDFHTPAGTSLFYARGQ